MRRSEEADTVQLDDLSHDALLARERELDAAYRRFQAAGLTLDLTRGKPSSTQLGLSDGLLQLDGGYQTANGTDTRNYGGLDGLAEAPALGPAAVEELLRYASPVQAVYRIVTEPCELHGVSLRPGERVYAVIASANRDERQFEDPHELRLDRELGAQLGFGAGTHVCMGAFMARIELRVALGLLLERVPHPRCVIPLEHLAWRRTWAIRELERLPVRAG